VLQTFGINLVEIEQNSNMKQYILVNKEEFLRDASDLKWPEEVEAQQVLLMLVLSLIFMSGGVVKEGMGMKADVICRNSDNNVNFLVLIIISS
jgi:hypothetical protein